MQLPARQLHDLVESGDFGFCDYLQDQAMGDLMKKLAACVGVFSHSAVNNDKLKDIQRLEEDLRRVYGLTRRNDTMCFVICYLQLGIWNLLFIL